MSGVGPANELYSSGKERNMANQKYWDFVNRIQVDNPAETRRRCDLAIAVLDKAPISTDDYDDMISSIAYIYRESYHSFHPA